MYACFHDEQVENDDEEGEYRALLAAKQN